MRRFVKEDAMHGEGTGVRGPSCVDRYFSHDIADVPAAIASADIADCLDIGIRVELLHRGGVIVVGISCRAWAATWVHDDDELLLRASLHPE